MEIIKELESIDGLVIHSDVSAFPKDIDICIPSNSIMDVKSVFKKHKATNIYERSGGLKYILYNNEDTFLFDVKYNFDSYTSVLSSIKLSEYGELKLINDVALNKSFKYLCQGRRDKTFYINENLSKVSTFLNDKNNFTYISNNISRNTDISSLFTFFKQDDILSNFASVLKSKVLLLKEFINCRKDKRLFKSIAFIGPDGSGKSYYISKVNIPAFVEHVYMGDWFFRLQNIYNKMMGIKTPYNRVVYLAYFIENLFRSMKVLFLKYSGRLLLIDRFPGTNRNVVKTGALGLINKITFNLIPKPDHIVLLYADPKTVHERKQELTVDEIRKIQESIKILVGEKLIVINTTDKNTAMNQIYSLIFEKS